MNILVLGDFEDGIIKDNTLKAISAANQISKHIDLLFIGYKLEKIVNSADFLNNISNIIIADSILFKDKISEKLASQILLLINKNKYDFIISGSTLLFKDILSYLSGKLNVPYISDVIKIINNNTFERLTYSGRLITTIKSLSNINIISIRNTKFEPISIGNKNNNYNKFYVSNFIPDNINSILISKNNKKSSNLDLNTAKKVIGVGKGIETIKNLNLIKIIANKINAAIGATRAIVDAGYIDNEFQIGQTGKIIAPDIYIAIGISGSIQHLAGIKDSKNIISINKDPDAQIFSVSNYGIICDINLIIPELIKKLNIKI